MRGVPARWGGPARGIPTLLDRPKNTTSRDRAGTPLPPLYKGVFIVPLWEGARGKESRLERGCRLMAFSNCGQFGCENTTSRVPPTSRDPLSLLNHNGNAQKQQESPLAAQCEIPPPYRAIPFRDRIAEGGIAPICLVFIGYRASIAEIALLGGVSHLHFACSPRGKRSEKVRYPIGHVETPKTP